MVRLAASSLFHINTPNFFNLKLTQQNKDALLNLSLNIPIIYSSGLKNLTALDTLLPSIYNHKCFNYKKQSFKSEAANTEVGHLYEHILLEYLYQLKGSGSVIKGITNWDWNQNPKGTFEIKINSKTEDLYLLREALNKTNILMQSLIS